MVGVADAQGQLVGVLVDAVHPVGQGEETAAGSGRLVQQHAAHWAPASAAHVGEAPGHHLTG